MSRLTYLLAMAALALALLTHHAPAAGLNTALRLITKVTA